MDAMQRFLAKVVKTNSCWEWQGALTSSKPSRGYGQLSVNGRLTLAHRFAFESFKGPIPEGLEIDHLCGISGSRWLTFRLTCWLTFVVPRAGFEPARTEVQRILSPSRLPIPPPRLLKSCTAVN